MHFSFIFFLALGAVVDPYVELRRPNVKVESHKEALMEVVVLCKLRPAALEVLLTGAIVPDLYFIRSSSPRVFMKTSFPQFSPIRKLGEFQRQTLNLTTLRAGDAEEGVESGRRRRSISRRSAWTWCSRRHLGFIFLPTGRPGHRFIGADDEATAALIEALFLLPRGRPRPHFSTGAPMFRRDPPASAMEIGVGKKKP
jgi:hypothetical protein